MRTCAVFICALLHFHMPSVRPAGSPARASDPNIRRKLVTISDYEVMRIALYHLASLIPYSGIWRSEVLTCQSNDRSRIKESSLELSH